MAHYHDYHSPDQNRINYAELEQSRLGSKGILIGLGLIALAAIAMFVFGGIESTTSALGTGEQTPAPATPVVHAE